jgi:membrane protease YdiL (CAAX protease family)
MSEKFKRIGLFTGITYGLSWAIIALMVAYGGAWSQPVATIVVTTLMFMPMVSAILVQKVIYKEPLLKPLGVSFRLNRWWLMAWLLPPAIALVTIGVSLLLPGVSYSPEMAGFFERFEGIIPPELVEQMREQLAAFPVHVFWIALGQGLLAGVTINAVAGFGEELGWRGFLFSELGHMDLWKSSAIIGLIWGIWHFPLILLGQNYPQHPVAGVFMMILFSVLLSPIFGYVRLKSKSVIAAAVAHGSLNGTAGLAIMVVEGGSDLIVGVTGAAGLIVLMVVDVCIFVFDRSIRGKTVDDMIGGDQGSPVEGGPSLSPARRVNLAPREPEGPHYR